MNTIRLVYGTLRNGFGLYKSANLDQPHIAKYLGTFEIDGYEMYDNGFYPYVIKGKGKIVVEAYDIKDEGVLRFIDNIERGAGYMLHTVKFKLNDEMVIGYLYLYRNKIVNCEKVESGDYSKFKGIKQ